MADQINFEQESNEELYTDHNSGSGTNTNFQQPTPGDPTPHLANTSGPAVTVAQTASEQWWLKVTGLAIIVGLAALAPWQCSVPPEPFDDKSPSTATNKRGKTDSNFNTTVANANRGSGNANTDVTTKPAGNGNTTKEEAQTNTSTDIPVTVKGPDVDMQKLQNLIDTGAGRYSQSMQVFNQQLGGNAFFRDEYSQRLFSQSVGPAITEYIKKAPDKEAAFANAALLLADFSRSFHSVMAVELKDISREAERLGHQTISSVGNPTLEAARAERVLDLAGNKRKDLELYFKQMAADPSGTSKLENARSILAEEGLRANEALLAR